ncbi:arginine-tRNA-protein transferase, partial [Stachybotrys elegans]
DSSRFKPSRDQRQVVNRFNKYVIGDTYTKEAARLYPMTREQARRRNNEFCLAERIHEAQHDHIKTPPEPEHRLEVTLESNAFTEEKFLVYSNYQQRVHHEPLHEITRQAFRRFLCSSPLRRQVVDAPDGRKQRLGSYHQCYRLDGKLVAVGVLDLLPNCVSSVYFLYDEAIHKFSPGKLSAVYEIALAAEEGYGWWYPGFYIHSCPKMRYKLDYSPQEILDPIALRWDPLDSGVLSLLDSKPFVSLAEERDAGASGKDGTPQKQAMASYHEDDAMTDDSDEENGQSIFRMKLPGITPLSEIEVLDLDHIPLMLPGHPLLETCDLVDWDKQSIHSWPGIKPSVAELVAALDRRRQTAPSISKSSVSRHESASEAAMATNQVLLSPAELAYLHSSLSLRPPIRPDGRTPTQFRPLTAETGILPGTNGSARVCFSDGTEAIVGVKAEIEKSVDSLGRDEAAQTHDDDKKNQPRTRGDWLEMAVEIPGQRDDDAATIFLAEMLRESLLADGEFAKKLWINNRFHWRLYLDVLLISPPMSYPLPLLSLTTHLALLSTRLPKLKSEGDEDPLFNDDWEASELLYPREGAGAGSRPPITLLVVTVGDNIIFDPAKEELAVAETALAVSVAEVSAQEPKQDTQVVSSRSLRLLSVRTIDPPSRLTPPGVPSTTASGSQAKTQGQPEEGVWKAPLGGTKFSVMDSIIQAVLEKGGVADEVLDGLRGVDLA